MTYPWTAGEVLAAADLNSAFAAKSDYAPTQNTQTGTGASAYTFVLADATRMTVANAATAATYTIPPGASVAFVANSIINVTSIGAGTITFAAGAGVTVTNTAGTLKQYQAAMLVRTALDAWTVVPFAGGASLLKSSDVSATTGSPTITTSGGYTIYDFLGSGSITFGREGLCDLLLIGGGGSGSTSIGGGGGAGGLLALTNAYMPSGAQTVIVGAGGVGNTDGIGTNGVTSRVGPYYGVGGGAGGTASASVAIAAGVGGSGGGSGNTATAANTAGAGISGQGNDGGATVPGSSGNRPSGGGGGAGAVGVAGAAGVSGNGGAGTANSISGSSVTYAGGGGGGGSATTAGTGGAGGGGAGARTSNATNGTANLGGGGGGTDGPYKGGNGGSGRTIVRVLT